MAANETVYIVLFRGVGGATQLPTAQLRAALTNAGFRNVATYINSGNAIVASELNADHVTARIAALVERKFSFTKEILVVNFAEWSRIVDGNPFSEGIAEPTKLHVFVLKSEPAKESVAELAANAVPDIERFVLKGTALYLFTPKGFSRSKLGTKIDKVLKVATTARNWRTVLALAEIAQKMGGSGKRDLKR
jgi:uncharacterized protein (DUF1697 family)